jgi:uncharacterized protein involved in exopolysaccharide biosynthesis
MNSLVPAETVTLADVASVVFRRKWQIVITFVLIVGAAIALTLLTPKQYESYMKILVKNERADMIVSAGGADGSSYQPEVSETEINSEIELLSDFNLLQRVVIETGLDRVETTRGATVGERHTLAVDQAAWRLQRHLTVTPARKTNIIEIRYLDRDPRRAAAVLRHLAVAYLDEHLKVHAAPGTYEFFAGQTRHYQDELKSAEARLEQFRLQNGIVMLAQQKEAMLQQASEADVALKQANTAIEEYGSRIAATQRQLTITPARVVTQDRAVPNQYSVEHLGSMLAELQNRRTELLAKFRPEDRLVREVEQEIADTQEALGKATKAMASERSTDINPVYQALQVDIAKQQADLAGAQARRETLTQQARSYRGQLMQLGNASTEYDDLTRAQKEAEDNYQLYARKTEEARIAESLDRQKIANVAIAEPPTEPYLPAKPNVKLNLALGLLLALFISPGLAFGTEYLKRSGQGSQIRVQPSLAGAHLIESIDETSQLEALTGLPVLASVRLPKQVHD